MAGNQPIKYKRPPVGSFVAAALLVPVLGNMYDVVEDIKTPPAACGAAGCARWSDLGSGAAVLFADGTAGAERAGKYCAQPGNAVNSRPLGAWCFCESSGRQSSDGEMMSAALPGDPDHPLDGQVVALFNVYDSEDLYVSFAYTAAPDGMPADQEWFVYSWCQRHNLAAKGRILLFSADHGK
eukprot:m.354934 g.354934  ORF g.354934 m.354934 type:complete len:182 (+) comp20730_c0_seq4:109-654(+)